MRFRGEGMLGRFFALWQDLHLTLSLHEGLKSACCCTLMRICVHPNGAGTAHAGQGQRHFFFASAQRRVAGCALPHRRIMPFRAMARGTFRMRWRNTGRTKPDHPQKTCKICHWMLYFYASARLLGALWLAVQLCAIKGVLLVVFPMDTFETTRGAIR